MSLDLESSNSQSSRKVPKYLYTSNIDKDFQTMLRVMILFSIYLYFSVYLLTGINLNCLKKGI